MIKVKADHVTLVFNCLDEMTKQIEHEQETPYLDALAEAMETLFYGEPADEANDVFAHKLKEYVEKIEKTDVSTTDLRKGIQLALLNGMQQSTQSNHLITPEAVALLVGYISEKLLSKKETIRLFNIGSGAGNLLLTVLEVIQKKYIAYAAEVDSTLIRIALHSANLQQKKVEFFHQDALRPLLLDPVDLVVGDIPIGYYPDDETAKDYELCNEEGHSYSHYLFIEQALNYTEPGGFVTLLIPDFLFATDESKRLHQFIHEHAQIIGLMRLPESSFKSKEQVKSIFILQKKKAEMNLVKQPLLVQFPSLNDAVKMENVLGQIDQWFVENEFVE